MNMVFCKGNFRDGLINKKRFFALKRTFAKKKSLIQVDMKGHFNVKNIQNLVEVPLRHVMEGQSPYDARLLISPHTLEGSLFFHSLLSGIAIHLPDFLGKTKSSQRDFTLQIDLRPRGYCRVNYGHQVNAYLAYRHVHEKMNYQRGEIRLGKGQAVLPDNEGLRIVGTVPYLTLEHWLPMMGHAWGHAMSQQSWLQIMSIRIQHFVAFGQHIHHLDVNFLPWEQGHVLRLSSQQLSGRIFHARR